MLWDTDAVTPAELPVASRVMVVGIQPDVGIFEGTVIEPIRQNENGTYRVVVDLDPENIMLRYRDRWNRFRQGR
jgi:hypothetical protein